MRYNASDVKKAARDNKRLLFPFISILIIAAIARFMPMYGVIAVSSEGRTVFALECGEGDRPGISYYDAEKDARVLNLFEVSGGTLILREMRITGDGVYVPSEDDFPDAVITKTDGGYTVTEMNTVYDRVAVPADYGEDFSVILGDREYSLESVSGEVSAIELSLRKMNMGDVSKYGPEGG